MNTNYEDWNVKEWLECLGLREKVLGSYYHALDKYIGLPACEELVERELRRKYDADTLDLTLGAITSPITYIIHEWDKDKTDEMDFDDEEDDDDDEEAERPHGPHNSSKKDGKVLGETCYSGIIDITDKWIDYMKGPIAGSSRKIVLSILRSLSEVACVIYSCAYSKHYERDARVCAMIQVAINKCSIIAQCMRNQIDEFNGPADMNERIDEILKKMAVLECVLKEYLSEVLAPHNRS